MILNKKSVIAGDTEVYHTETIYARIMCLLGTNRIKLDEVLKYNLTPIPDSLFKEDSDIYFDIQVEMSARLQSPPDSVIVDGCALLWTVHWPSRGTVQNLVDTFYKYIGEKLISSDVYLVFEYYTRFNLSTLFVNTLSRKLLRGSLWND